MSEFTEDEIVALKELVQEHIRFNKIIHRDKTKTNPKPNVCPRSFAEEEHKEIHRKEKKHGTT